MSIAGKILAKFLMNRLNEHFDQAGLQPESQCGFRKDRGSLQLGNSKRNAKNKMWTST